MTKSCLNSLRCARGGFVNLKPNMKRAILALFIFFLPAFSLLARDNPIPFELKVFLSKDNVGIGEKIKYTIEVKTKKGVEVDFGEFDQEKSGFEIKDSGLKKSGFFSNKKLKQWYVLDSFKTGRHEIGFQPIKYKRAGQDDWQQIETDILDVTVYSALALAPDENDIRDIKGPISPGANLKKIILILLGLAAAAAGGFYLYRFKKKKDIESIHIPTADEIAYRALERLKAKEYPKAGLIKQYYAELSLIARHYLEGRFDLRAPEMTTEEFLHQLKSDNKLNSEQKSLLKDFLSHCDMVKFAKYGPTAQEIEESFQSAKRLIDQTRVDIFPSPSDPGSEGE